MEKKYYLIPWYQMTITDRPEMSMDVIVDNLSIIKSVQEWLTKEG